MKNAFVLLALSALTFSIAFAAKPKFQRTRYMGITIDKISTERKAKAKKTFRLNETLYLCLVVEKLKLDESGDANVEVDVVIRRPTTINLKAEKIVAKKIKAEKGKVTIEIEVPLKKCKRIRKNSEHKVILTVRDMATKKYNEKYTHIILK